MTTVIPTALAACLPARIIRRAEELAAAGLFRGGELSEIRLRTDRPASLTAAGQNLMLPDVLTPAELADCVTSLCRGSVYAHDDTIRQGYIRFEGGIRVGICGTRLGDGVREFTSLCIRVPHAVRDVSEPILRYFGGRLLSLLIYAPPGVGKTTLLRDLAAKLARTRRVVLLDTRGELYLPDMFAGTLCDVLVGYGRAEGMEIAARTMSPEVIVCDELGDAEEARQILSAQHTGVPVIASAHASDVPSLLARPGIRMLHDSRIFDAYAGIRRERISGRLSGQFHCTFTRAAEADACSG